MPASLDSDIISEVVDSFPLGENWRTFECRVVIRQMGTTSATWVPLRDLRNVGGVYAVLLPATHFEQPRTIHLHGPNGCRIPFVFTINATVDAMGIAYVGRTTNFAQRWQGHLSPGERKDGGQVKYGLLDSGVCGTQESALMFLRAHGRIMYYVLSGEDNCANRDIIEMTLCAKFKPPFNIKSEH